MPGLRTRLLLASILTAATSIAFPAAAQSTDAALTASALTSATKPDSDGVYPDSRFRLPLPRRDALDVDAQRIYDKAIAIAGGAGRGKSGAGTGLNGPSGILLYSPRLAELSMDTNYYLRFQSGLDDRMREIAILAVAREADNDFEWTQHVAIARRVRVEETLITTLATRGPIDHLPEQDATIITLVRESVTNHRVSLTTYSRALKLLGPEKLVNLSNVIGNYLANAVVLSTFGMTLSSEQPSSLPARASIEPR